MDDSKLLAAAPEASAIYFVLLGIGSCISFTIKLDWSTEGRRISRSICFHYWLTMSLGYAFIIPITTTYVLSRLEFNLTHKMAAAAEAQRL